MAEGTSNKGKRYSVYRLEWCKPDEDANDPDTTWNLVAVFETENDAVTSKNLLEDCKEWSKKTFSIVREIRERDTKPLSNRRIV
jgi:hypothetical protein